MKSSQVRYSSGAVSFFVGVVLLCAQPAVDAASATWSPHRSFGLWNAPGNWDPMTVPNGPSDEATFGDTRGLDVNFSHPVEVGSIHFLPEIRFEYNIGLYGEQAQMVIAGAGVINEESALPHSHFAVTSNPQTTPGDTGGRLYFVSSASAGNFTTYNVSGVMDGSPEEPGRILFRDHSTAGAAPFVTFAGGSTIEFHSFATAGDADLTNNGGVLDTSIGGNIEFFGHSSAGHASIANRNGYTLTDAGHTHQGATLQFHDNSTAGSATIENFGSGTNKDTGGVITFSGIADAGNCSIDNRGSYAAGGAGAMTIFEDQASAATATLIADENFSTNGSKGGNVIFLDDSGGGTAQLVTISPGVVDISGHHTPGLTVGSLSGDGSLFLGANNLTIGSNNLTATFTGVIADGGSSGGAGGSLTKLGGGVLILGGANTYTGGTTINRGDLIVTNSAGSATGTGPVQIAFGKLGGFGIISGSVDVGTGSAPGAALSPAASGGQPGTLTLLGALTFHSDGTYNFDVDSANAAADGVTANGVALESGALFNSRDLSGIVLPAGTVFTAINNTAAIPIAGIFSNLADNSTLTVGANTYLVSYEGGTGNDLTLTVQ